MWISVWMASAWAMPGPGPCVPDRRFASYYYRPPSINSIVSDRYPIRVHWNRAEDADKAPIYLEAAETSWQIQVDEMGFRPPALPDSYDGPELDMYLAGSPHVSSGAAWVDGESWPYVDLVPGDGYNGVPAYAVFDQNLREEWIPSYVAHEFAHVLQFGTDFSEWTTNVWEASATAAQHWTFGMAVGEWDYDVYAYQEAAFAPSLVGDAYGFYYSYYLGGTFEYGAALWVMHLDEILGDGDGQKGVELWEALAHEGFVGDTPDVLDAVVEVSGLDSLGAFMNSLAKTRWLTGLRWDDRGLEIAQDWTFWEQVDSVRMTLEDLPSERRFDPGLMTHGQGFVLLEVGETTETLLQVELESDSGLQSALMAMGEADSKPAGEWEAVGEPARLSIPIEGLDQVVIVATNMGPEGFDDRDYAYDPSDHVLKIYTGEPVTSTTSTSTSTPTTSTGTTPTTSTGTTPTTSTGTTPTTPTTSTETQATDGPSGEELDSGKGDSEEGCGCSTTTPAPWGLGWGLGVWLMVRRRAAGRSRP